MDFASTDSCIIWDSCRHNMDYIVDKVCLHLRSPSASTKYSASSSSGGGSSDGNNASTHLIVDFVFSTLDTTVQESSEGSSTSGGECHSFCNVVCFSTYCYVIG